MDSNNFLEGLIRPPTATSRLTPISPQAKELQPHPPPEDNGERRGRRRSTSNGSNKSASNEDSGDKPRRSKVFNLF